MNIRKLKDSDMKIQINDDAMYGYVDIYSLACEPTINKISYQSNLYLEDGPILIYGSDQKFIRMQHAIILFYNVEKLPQEFIVADEFKISGRIIRTISGFFGSKVISVYFYGILNKANPYTIKHCYFH